jgi:hypothetical protein
MLPFRRSASATIATLLSTLLSAQLGVVGFMQVVGAEPIATNLRHLGVPTVGRVAVGLLQLAAVIALWVRPARFAAALALVVILTGAVAAHLAAGEGVTLTLPAVMTWLLASALAYLRRADRPQQFVPTPPSPGAR